MSAAEQKIGIKFDGEKPQMDLIPPLAELKLAQVLTAGAQKYSPDNWRHVDNAHARYIAACRRHINAYQQGEKLDDETGLPHLAHAMCCLAFIVELDEEAGMQKEFDEALQQIATASCPEARHNIQTTARRHP